MEFRLASAAFIAVVAAYLFLGGMGVTDRWNPEPRDAAYNALARGLLHGRLSVDREVPQGLARMKDPWDPRLNAYYRDNPDFRLHDFSFYKGRLYLYFGVAPALLVFAPWHVLTGGWLPLWAAVVLLCSATVLVSLSLVRAVRLRMAPQAPPWMGAACVLILGFASYAPLLAARADMWEVPIAMAALATAAALRFLWEACTREDRPGRWLALASAALGVAFASRPTSLPVAAILLVPFALPRVRRSAAAWAGAVLPYALSGGLVALYNLGRFDNPFEFGQRFQMGAVRDTSIHHFGTVFLPENLRLYLFQGVDWTSLFPFAHEPAVGPIHARLPLDHGDVEHMSGLLLNAPVLWAALALAFLFRRRLAERAVVLFSVSAALAALLSLGLICLFFGTCSRYQYEFAPELSILACLGVFALERLLSGGALLAARAAWGAALLFTCAFTFLYGVDRCAGDHNLYGVDHLMNQQVEGARREFRVADALAPRNPFSRLGECYVLELTGRTPEAEAQLRSLVADHPDYAMARLTLGNLLTAQGRNGEALGQLREARRLDPESASIRDALAKAEASAR